MGPGPWPMCMLTFLTLWPIYLQTNFLCPTKNKFIFSKIIRIFSHGNIQFLLCAYINYYLKKIKEKVPGKVGECIFDSSKCQSFQGPKAGPGPLAKIKEKVPGKVGECIFDS